MGNNWQRFHWSTTNNIFLPVSSQLSNVHILWNHALLYVYMGTSGTLIRHFSKRQVVEVPSRPIPLWNKGEKERERKERHEYLP